MTERKQPGGPSDEDRALTGHALSAVYLEGIENALRDCGASDVARIARALEVDAGTRTAWYELLSNPIDSGDQ